MTELNTANAVYAGTHKADKVYLGSHLIWPSVPPSLPFPSTPILDNFNRANENPLNSTNWFSGFDGDSPLKLVSNHVTVPGTSGLWGSAAWKTVNPGNSEAYVDLVQESTGSGYGMLWVALQTLSTTADVIGYQLEMDNGAGWWLYRWDDEGNQETLIDAYSQQGFRNGDSAGLRVKDGTISVWRKPAGGAWGMLDSIADSTYTGGYIGLELTWNAQIWDNFGGGAIP